MNILSRLRYPLRIIKAVYRLPAHVDTLYSTRDDLTRRQEETTQELDRQKTAVTETTSELNEKIDSTIDHVNSVDTRLSSLSSLKLAPATSAPTPTAGRFADNHDLDEFYVGFEDKFRGDEASIKEKVKIYSPIIKKTGIDFSAFPVLDIGCGRGELLQALSEHSIRAIGLDINHDMVERATAHGFEAHQGDALEYLRSLPTNSVGAITGMHLVEHIPFEELISLFKECYRVVTPGGLVIFETPNPENLMVGIYSFYMDPSHLSPLPPPLLSFALENVGFKQVEIQRLHEAGKSEKDYDDPLLKDLAYRVYGPLDYAAIGTKPGAHKSKTLSAKSTRKPRK